MIPTAILASVLWRILRMSCTLSLRVRLGVRCWFRPCSFEVCIVNYFRSEWFLCWAESFTYLLLLGLPIKLHCLFSFDVCCFLLISLRHYSLAIFYWSESGVKLLNFMLHLGSQLFAILAVSSQRTAFSHPWSAFCDTYTCAIWHFLRLGLLWNSNRAGSCRYLPPSELWVGLRRTRVIYPLLAVLFLWVSQFPQVCTSLPSWPYFYLSVTRALSELCAKLPYGFFVP